MMAQFFLTLLLIIFALGGIAIVLFQINIIWRNTFPGKANRQQRKPQLTEQPEIEPLTLKVVERHDMSAKHFSVRLQAINGVALTDFVPGQYLSLMVPNSLEKEAVEDVESKELLKRCYSLASWQPETDFYELAIQPETKGKVSSWLHDNLHIGCVINALPPKGNFVINTNEVQHTVLIAGGIGITPLRAMVHQFIEQQSRISQLIEKRAEASSSHITMSLFYSAKTVEDMCYLDEFIQLANECLNFMFYPFLSKGIETFQHPIKDTIQFTPQFTMGRLNAEQLKQKLDYSLSDFHYYMCGPNTMMDELKYGLTQQGVAPESIHFERFSIEASVSDGQEYSVTLGGRESFMFNHQRNLLDAIEEQGIDIQSECRSGECGECKVNLLSGKVKPLIGIDIDLKEGEILTCCSVPESDLLIDI